MAVHKAHEVKPMEPLSRPQPVAEGAASLTGESGPTQAMNLLEHPALRDVLSPLPMTFQGVDVKALIDRAVEELVTRTPHLIIPGVSICNRLGDGEKSVIHLPGLREKQALLWDEFESCRAADAKEIVEVARCIEASLGVPCDAAGALAVLVGRMKALLRESMHSGIESERALQLGYKISDRESSLTRRLLQLIPAVRSQDLELKSELAQTRRRAEYHAKPHGESYVACPRRAGVSLMFGRIDSLWYYLPAKALREAGESASTEQASYKTQRINTYSIALASVGIFQKGVGGWDQHYPSSPLEFWKDHVEPYLAPPAQR